MTFTHPARRGGAQQFLIGMANSDTGVERVIGVIRRRGFRVVRLTAETDAEDKMRIRVVVANPGDRSFHALARHLEKLLDVASVHAAPPELFAGASVVGASACA